MASLLNMLNNFLGSSGKPSLFNLNSTNVNQEIDFNSIIQGLLSGGEGEQQTLNSLLPSASSGPELPLPDAGGKVLPSMLPTDAGDSGLPLLLSQGDVSQLPSLSAAAPAIPAAVQPADESATQAADTAVAVAAGETSLVQAAAPGRSAALPLTQEQQAPAQIEAVPTQSIATELVGAAGRASPAADSAAATPELAPAAGPVQRGIDPDAEMSRSVKLDTPAPAAASHVQPQADATPRTASTAAPEPTSSMMTATTVSAAAPAPAASIPAGLPAEAGQPRVAVADETTGATGANSQTAAATRQVTAHAAPQQASAAVAMPAVKEPQQVVLEQVQTTSSDSEAPADNPRPAPLPTAPVVRPAPVPSTPLPAAEPSLANFTAMLNQGQSMNNLSERLHFMLHNGQSSAEVQLDPPELGSVQVRVTTRHEQTSIIFVAPNALTREALEQQLPRLRETLEGAGLQLQDANVFAQADDKAGSRPQSYQDMEATDALLAEESAEQNSKASGSRISIQLVDAYI